jgi:rRNA-processing protein FCF1
MPSRIVLDTSILLLLLVGLADRNLVAKHKRTRTYEPAGFDTLVRLIKPFAAVVITPQVLAETSNLLRDGPGSASGPGARITAVLKAAQERYVPKDKLLESPLFLSMGATDVSVMELAHEADTVVLTDDLELYGRIEKAKRNAVNFTHVIMSVQ